MEDRFGIPRKVFEGYVLLRKGKSWWLLKDSPLLEMARRLKISLAGMRAFNRVGGFIKPTTRLIQVFGKKARKAVLEISKDQLYRLASGERIEADLAVEKGYVILRYKGRALGLGFYANGTVLSQLPKKDLKFLIGGDRSSGQHTGSGDSPGSRGP
ncbi:MAG: hypothetical protein JRH13_01465 [Deltaproteobacteria bacterium]|nr:hypothetical protein [Deltaproteobacteria bacterium]MBW2015389.1 hypothetical protein [Deltaproteobacteria bacterium]MBW2128017.1 hypothetical protein [Deltaproteobacteria bacterium]MBW2302596.1 hypothetical protein [Deltaproteobacteria bacterium]